MEAEPIGDEQGDMTMEAEPIGDLASLEPYFAELKTWPEEFTLTAAMWNMLSQRVKDALEADLVEAGYQLTNVRMVEYRDGQLWTVGVVVRSETSDGETVEHTRDER